MAEGLQQVLNMKPSVKTLETYIDLFSSSCGNTFCDRQPVNSSTVQRALAETEYSIVYVALVDPPHTSTQDD